MNNAISLQRILYEKEVPAILYTLPLPGIFALGDVEPK